MAGPLWPVVHTRLLTLVPSVSGWSGVRVFDGPPVTGDAPETFCTVGWVDGEDSAGDWSQEGEPIGGFTHLETGLVRCELVAFSGGDDLPGLRSRVFGLMGSLYAALVADQTLGVLPRGSTCALAGDVVPVQSQAGTVQRVPFSVQYSTRTV